MARASTGPKRPARRPRCSSSTIATRWSHARAASRRWSACRYPSGRRSDFTSRTWNRNASAPRMARAPAATTCTPASWPCIASGRYRSRARGRSSSCGTASATTGTRSGRRGITRAALMARPSGRWPACRRSTRIRCGTSSYRPAASTMSRAAGARTRGRSARAPSCARSVSARGRTTSVRTMARPRTGAAGTRRAAGDGGAGNTRPN
mmetsp:Transcript_23030/g.58473  ORF Transcript_23030/g.58473 Transcript_23030/m.58473 type:complete len:208 (+) Transcript_23030:328-951(+)